MIVLIPSGSVSVLLPTQSGSISALVAEGSITVSTSAIQTIAGPTGSSGPPGVIGATGPIGPTGPAGPAATFSFSIKNQTSYTLINSDDSVENQFQGATFLLPPSPVAGQKHAVYTLDALLTVNGNGNLINGLTTAVLQRKDSIEFQYTGTQWRLL